MPKDTARCERCGGTLVLERRAVNYECDDCGMVVAPEILRR